MLFQHGSDVSEFVRTRKCRRTCRVALAKNDLHAARLVKLTHWAPIAVVRHALRRIARKLSFSPYRLSVLVIRPSSKTAVARSLPMVQRSTTQSFKVIVEGFHNLDRIIRPFRFNHPLTVTATQHYAENGFCCAHAELSQARFSVEARLVGQWIATIKIGQ